MDDSLTYALVRLADGDRSAFAEVYQAAAPRVDALCARLLGPGPDAEDAAQQTLLRVFSRVGDYQPEIGPALPWILALAAWECRTLRQKARRRREGDLEDVQLLDTRASPEQAILTSRLELALHDVIGTLRPLDRQTVLAVLGHECRPDVSPATFRKRLERALERIKAAWRDAHG